MKATLPKKKRRKDDDVSELQKYIGQQVNGFKAHKTVELDM